VKKLAVSLLSAFVCVQTEASDSEMEYLMLPMQSGVYLSPMGQVQQQMRKSCSATSIQSLVRGPSIVRDGWVLIRRTWYERLILFCSRNISLYSGVCWALGVMLIHAEANAICHLYFSANTALCFVNDRPPQGGESKLQPAVICLCVLGLLRRIVGKTHTTL
jgi:hypothetical protein